MESVAELLDTKSERLNRKNLLNRYKQIRAFTEELTAPLETEDYVIQAMDNVSPTKWHLAHTSWFFETFVLEKTDDKYRSLHPQYHHLFNSYYLQTGEPYTRKHRGLITRPTVKQTYEYRSYVDEKIEQFIEQASENTYEELAPVIEIGLNHEQQHQELIITDIKYNLSQNPLDPVYKNRIVEPTQRLTTEINWIPFEEGIYEIGHKGNGFSYDNEHPRHKRFCHAFEITNRPITNAEYIEFIEDEGYQRSEFWLSDGYAAVQEKNWKAPLYWFKERDTWRQFTLSGIRNVEPAEPVTHISYYEAEAYAHWAGARLPDEAEWEVAARSVPVEGNFVEQKAFHPLPLEDNTSTLQALFGDVWEWTKSAYDAYPGFKTLPGALGEYNGKFMSSQYVLRGGSCATSSSHIRPSYRNFFYPDARWQFSGIRLARLLK